MLVHLFHEVTSGTAVLAGVEFTRLVVEHLAHGSGECQTRVRVDVDFANGALGSLAELLFGDTHCIGELAAVLVDDINVFLRNRRRSVKHDGESGELFHDLIEDVECQWGRNEAAGLGVACALLGFGRRAILNLRQTLASKILDLQKDAIYTKFKDLEGDLVTGEVYQVWKREVLLMDEEKNELLLPKDQQIPTDVYRKGETVRAVIYNVDNKNNNPKITVSRTCEQFLRRLFELEVPEIHDGLIVIRAVARIPGERAKIAVESYDDRIDPVGACVGVRGARIHGIVRELRNENIDVINYTSNPQLFIQRALSPAKISSIRLDEENKRAEVFLRAEEVSLAIGKGGLNIKLASMLTGYTIDVYRDLEAEGEEDIYLDEFKDEIDDWVVEALKNMGCATAKAVLRTPREELIEKADLEEDTVDNVISILKAEFEE